jgi:hypothetical protein
VNSAVHSYLVLRYAEGNKAAVTVGFYYCSNAAGRLFGTLLSGVLYTYAGSSSVDGFGWCAAITMDHPLCPAIRHLLVSHLVVCRGTVYCKTCTEVKERR